MLLFLQHPNNTTILELLVETPTPVLEKVDPAANVEPEPTLEPEEQRTQNQRQR